MVRFLRIAGYVSLAASVTCGIVFFATNRYYHEYGEFSFAVELLHVFLGLTMLAMPLACGLLGVLALVLAFGMGRSDCRRLLRSSGLFALTCVLTIAVQQALPGGLPKPQRAEFMAVAEAGQPLIEAIRRYESDHTSPPASLEALVPGYLPAIPKTGHARYLEFEYDTFDPGDGPAVGVTWQLRVPVTASSDTFFYWQTEDYSQFYGPRSIEMIGRWAYHHG